MRSPLAALLATAAALPAAAQDTPIVPAELVDRAILPAFSFSAPPEGAPDETWISGRYTSGTAPIQEPQSQAPINGLRLPFFGQPIQGFSGFAADLAEDGHHVALIDNGFGSLANSSDTLLSYVHLEVDFDAGTFEVAERYWLSDPDHHVPFRIVHEATEERFLTGADFDIESIQIVGDTVWIGDEFGPYLISATLDGEVTGVYPTIYEGEEIRSPDHPALRIPAAEGVDWTLPRSGGYEGMALREDGMLWALLEKPLVDETGANVGDYLLMLEFDPEAAEWTGESLRFPLTPGAVAIGDFNFIDENRALIIERDGGQGTADMACAEGEEENCFSNPAAVKRVTLVDLSDVDEDGNVARIAQIDLLAIEDPQDVAGEGDGDFAFPYVTIEGVFIEEGGETILISNDNNLPFSAGRTPGEADFNEIIRLSVPELLSAE